MKPTGPVQGRPPRYADRLRTPPVRVNAAEQAEIRQRLQRAEAQVLLLSEQSMMGILILLAGRVSFANRLFARICGYSLETVQGWSREDLQRVLGDNLNGGAAQEACINTGEGALKWVEIGRYAVPGSAPPAELITAIDITEKKLMEEAAKRQREALVEAGRLASLGLLASGIAHEISNPSQVILSYAELLEENWKLLHPLLQGMAPSDAAVLENAEEIRTGIDAIRSSCRKISAIVEELRDYARSVDGDPREPVSIRRIVDGALQLTHHQILRATHSFRVDVATNLPVLRGSSRRLLQVVINLIDGTCFSYQELQRRCALQIQARYDPVERAVTLQIDAEGPLGGEATAAGGGFPASRRSELLGPSLGMAISSSIVSEHGGSLQVTHDPQQGIRTCLKLPVGD